MNKAKQVFDQNQEKFKTLYSLYEEYNSHTNISAIRNEAEVIEKHFLDSLEILDHQSFKAGDLGLDLGSGGGFPVLPLAIVLPEVNFVALDGTAKKTKFITMVKEKLNLTNLTILTGRAEVFAHEEEYREKFDFVLVRAFSKLNILFELASGFLKPKASLFAYKSFPIDDEEKEAKKSAKETAISLKARFLVHADRQILQYKKIAALSASLPREFAKIKSKPL